MESMENNFWWSIELETEPDLPSQTAEETLATLADLSGSIGGEIFEESGRTVFRAAYRSSQDLSYWLGLLEAMLAETPGVRIRSHSKIENRPWHTEHLESFPPLSVGKHLAVMAPWHREKVPAGRIPVYIYPSSAFGTGYHESTRIALTLLEPLVKPNCTVIDVGTGTGVLFIAALKIGASHATARDLDPTTLSEVSRNMELNDLPPERCDLAVGDLLNGVDIEADLLTANILLEPNLCLLKDVRRVLKPQGIAVFAGMTTAEREVFLSALPAAGLDVLHEEIEGEWWGVAARPSI